MKYSDLSKRHRALKALDRTNSDDAFWTAHAEFKHELGHAIRDEGLLRKMTKPQLIQLIAWCGTFRPAEPHVVLSKIGKLAESDE